MKKYIIIAAAAIAAIACTKSETAQNGREITFQIAKNTVQTKASGEKYDTSVPFGTYAWFNNTDDFMVNEQVGFASSVWKTVDHTFYWPKTGSISFISYSPFAGTSNTAGTVPVVTKNSISYTGLTAGNDDIMYADRATCSANVNEVTDSDTADSGFNGVPTVFHHALAKLSFKVKANFLEWDDANNGSHTEWEVTLNSFKIGGFKNTGDCTLNLNANGINWDKPQTTVGSENFNVWTNLSGATAEQELIPSTSASGIVLTTTAQDLNPAAGFVIPQVLEASDPADPSKTVQTVHIVAHIKTTLSNGKVINEPFDKVIDISSISSCKAWEMNQNIVYTIKFKPTSADQNNPHYDDPNDVIITFDPAVAPWDNVDASATIQL